MNNRFESSLSEKAEEKVNAVYDTARSTQANLLQKAARNIHYIDSRLAYNGYTVSDFFITIKGDRQEFNGFIPAATKIGDILCPSHIVNTDKGFRYVGASADGKAAIDLGPVDFATILGNLNEPSGVFVPCLSPYGIVNQLNRLYKADGAPEPFTISKEFSDWSDNISPASEGDYQFTDSESDDHSNTKMISFK